MKTAITTLAVALVLAISSHAYAAPATDSNRWGESTFYPNMSAEDHGAYGSRQQALNEGYVSANPHNNFHVVPGFTSNSRGNGFKTESNYWDEAPFFAN